MKGGLRECVEGGLALGKLVEQSGEPRRPPPFLEERIRDGVHLRLEGGL